METMVALVGFSFVSTVTPGPNNVLLWASGATFGVRASLRHVVGTALGIGGMALVAAAGLGALVTAVPAVDVVMKLAASAYLLFLAFQVAGAHALERGVLGRPLGLVQAAAFQVVNPKAWIFALGAIAAFRPAGLPVATGSVLVAATMSVIVIPTAAIWAVAGGALAGWLAADRAGRAVSIALAALLAATVAFVWI